jgi:hypothetical protein
MILTVIACRCNRIGIKFAGGEIEASGTVLLAATKSTHRAHAALVRGIS